VQASQFGGGGKSTGTSRGSRGSRGRATPTPQQVETVDELLAQGMALYTQEKYDEAIPLLKRVTKLDPRNSDAWNLLLAAYFPLASSMGDVDVMTKQALPTAEQALALDPALALGWLVKATALYLLKRKDEALVAYDRALALAPKHAIPSVLSVKGDVLCSMGRCEEALGVIDVALALNPTYEDAWKNRGKVLHELGRKAEAKQAERRAKELGHKP
jgi:tetratricopeptide (TPR) repeat protein